MRAITFSVTTHPYIDVLAAQVEEVMRMFNPTGVFLDISDVRICYCSYCVKSMKKLGLDPKNHADVRRHGEMVLCRVLPPHGGGGAQIQSRHKYIP